MSVRSADEYYQRGNEDLRRKKNLAAITEFQGVVYNYPGDSRVDSAQYFLALAYFNEKNYALATVEFDRLLASYPSSPLAEEAQFMKAAALFEGSPKSPSLDQTDLVKAVKQLGEFVSDNPESQSVSDAKTYLNRGNERLAARLFVNGMVYLKIRAYDAAERYFQEVIDEYTGTSYGARATYQLAEVAFARKNFKKAAELYTNFGVAFPNHLLAPQAVKRLAQANAYALRFPNTDARKDSSVTPSVAIPDSASVSAPK